MAVIRSARSRTAAGEPAAGTAQEPEEQASLARLMAEAPRVIDLTDRVARSRSAGDEVEVAGLDGYGVDLPWERRLVAAVLGVDVVAILVSCLVALTFRVFDDSRHPSALRYLVVSGALTGLWVAAMAVSRAYEARFLGLGSEEFKRVFNAAVLVIAAIATVSYAINSPIGRRYVVLALPLATLLSLAGRYGLRKSLVRLRRAGRCLHTVVVVGNEQTAADMIRTIRHAPYAGMTVVGCCLDARGAARVRAVESVPVLGTPELAATAIKAVGASAVVVTSNGEVTAHALRRMAWQLEGTGVDILVAPTLTDVAGPRIHIRPVAGLPLLHVEEPEMSGGRRLLKGLFDRSVALAALLLLLPAFVAVGVAVRADSRGPVLFRQRRVGRGGREFTIYKFRSMHVDAEARLEALLPENDADGVLFKIRKDPRVTRVGRFLRRTSLDELPQLINVLLGDMSLVGPRPPLPHEVARYEHDVRRRLLVKPGLTGLWQVSGRSDLTWDESVRLDLSYVENWSLALDFMIIWKTLFVVLRGSGAY